MIFLFEASGASVSVTPEKVYQGSNRANTVYFLCPTSLDNSVNVAFTLGDGTVLPQAPMSLCENFNGLIDTANRTVNAWKYELPSVVTQNAGVATVQFFVSDVTGVVVSTEAVDFAVEKGVPVVEPQAETYQSLINAFNAFKTQTLEAVEEGLSQAGNADGKLDKISTTSTYAKAYVKNANGAQSQVDISSQNVANSIVMRDTNGAIFLETPTANLNANSKAAANKGYVDSQKIYMHHIRAAGSYFDIIACGLNNTKLPYFTTDELTGLFFNSYHVIASGWVKNASNAVLSVFGINPGRLVQGNKIKILAYNPATCAEEEIEFGEDDLDAFDDIVSNVSN